MRKTPRPYQLDADAGIRKDLETYTATLCVLPTGMGKSVVAAKLLSEWPQGNCLFLAHTQELVNQAAEHLERELGYAPIVEMGLRGGEFGMFHQGGMTVIASVQSMVRDRRLRKFDRYPFGLIAIDECFPAGTLIDGKPIEDISVGECVTSFDENTGELAKKRVVRKFVNPAPSRLVTITAAGRSVTSTLNHPFLTSRGWINAGNIEVGDCVYGMFQDIYAETWRSTEQLQKRPKDVLVHQAMSRPVEIAASPGCLPPLQNRIHGCDQRPPSKSEKRSSGLLFGTMQKNCMCSNISKVYGCDEQKICICTNEGQQPYESSRDSRKSFKNHEGSWLQTCHTGWERPRHDYSGSNAVGSHWATSICNPNWKSTNERWASDSLQDRFGRPYIESGNRNRWRESQDFACQGCGSPQERFLNFARVESVEVQERGCDAEYEGMCPGCFVYNLEVEDHHTYIANEFAVHNCHRATSRSYRKITDYYIERNPHCKVVGFTATPKRADKTALGLVFESVGYAMDIPDAIDGGWLVPVREKTIVVSDVEITGPNTTNEFGEKDFSNTAVESVMIDEEALRATAEPLVKETVGRQTIVFCASVRHAHELAAVIDWYAPGSAAAVDGETPRNERDEIVNRFKSGRLQYLLNANLFIEGFDAPNCSCVAITRPTKSTGRYTQMVGRALRPQPGSVDGIDDAQERKLSILTSDKPDALILDFVNAGAVGLVTIDDVLGGNYDAATRELAAKIRKEGDTVDVKESQRRSKMLLALEKQMEERRSNAAVVEYQVYERDGRVVAATETNVRKRGTITDGQLSFLTSLGCDPDKTVEMSAQQAAIVIDKRKATHCTKKQRDVLMSKGVNPDGIGVDRASRIIDAIAANGWRPLQEVPE